MGLLKLYSRIRIVKFIVHQFSDIFDIKYLDNVLLLLWGFMYVWSY